MPLRRARLGDLQIEDERSFSHVALYADLKAIVERSDLSFLVPDKGELAWDAAALLNLTYWSPGVADVLAAPSIPADVVAHVAWHHLCDRSVAPSVQANLLGESVASAFDFYLVGRLLGRSPDAPFLETQVPRMAEAAEAAGYEPDAFERLLTEAAEAPERAFEDLRELLFDTSIALANAACAEDAAQILEAAAGHRFSPILHHYELANWVLRSKLYAATARTDGGVDARRVDAELRAAPDPVRWLEDRWLAPALSGAGDAKPRDERDRSAAGAAAARGAQNG